MTTVFVSYSHQNKVIARRVAYRLGAYGLPAWMDEREIRKGQVLETKIKQAIASSEAVVVIASRAASKSVWVQKELAHARTRKVSRPIYPFFVEDVKRHPLFATHLGFDALDPHHLEQQVLELAQALSGSPAPPSVVDAEALRAALRAFQAEDSAVGILAESLLYGEGLPVQQAESVMRVSFHLLDFTLNALYDLCIGSKRQSVVNLVASLFHRTGTGGYVLERHLVARGCSGSADARDVPSALLAIAVGRRHDRDHLDEALRLLATPQPPDDHALVDFIRANVEALTEAQWQTIVRLVTHPLRQPRTFTMDAAFEVLRHQPESQGVRLMWQQWITEGYFEQVKNELPHLAVLLEEAHEKRLACCEWISEDLVRHIRSLVRSRDCAKVRRAISYLVTLAQVRCPVAARIAGECEAAQGSREWEGWEHESEMGCYVSPFVAAALTDQNWVGAMDEYRKSWKAVQEFQEMRKNLL